MTVKELIAQIGTSLDKSSGKAAEILRVQGRTAYDAADYKTSLDLYLRAYKTTAALLQWCSSLLLREKLPGSQAI